MKIQRPNIELIVSGGRCHTFAGAARGTSAIAIAGGRVVAVGGKRDIPQWKSRGTDVVDVGDAVLTPGLVDCHTHLFYWALNRSFGIDVAALTTLHGVLQRINKQAAKRRFGEWVVGRGYDHNRWGTLPTADDLDRAVPRHPAIIHSRDGHSAWLNTRALAEAGITSDTPDPPGGRYIRDAHGAPTGIVQETAIEQLPDPVRAFARRRDAATRRKIAAAVQSAMAYARSVGITGVHTMDDAPSLHHLHELRQRNELTLRIVHAVPVADLHKASELGLATGFGDDWLRIGGIKIFSDGALGSQSAYMFEPYPDSKGDCGVPVIAGDALKDVVATAVERGWAVWIHAIGDRAVHESVLAITATRRKRDVPLPHRIEHAQCTRPADIRRMARAGIIASVQPCHILGDIPTAQRHWPRAQKNAYPFRRLLDGDVVLAGGSDVPIESIDPRRSLYGAVMRTDERGEPEGGWFADQRLTSEEALWMFTVGAARARGASDTAGTLIPGAPADVTIWDEDPLRAEPADLLHIGLRGSIVGGRVHLNA